MQRISSSTRWKRLAAAGVSLAVIVGACGGSDSDESDSDPVVTEPESDESTAPEGEESSESETEASDRDPNGILRYAGINAPSRLDPHRSTLSQDNDKLFLALDRLVHQAPNGDPVAGLATEWEFIDEGATLRFTLREGVTFHDGEPFNAEAVKDNIERAQTIEGGTQTGDLAVITAVTVVDDYTVDFTLDGPAAALPLILSDRAGAMLSPASFDNPDIDEKPIGAGMYKVVEHNVGSLIVYEAYEDYWDKDAQGLAGVEYHLMSDSGTRSNAIQSGAVDWTIVDNEAYDRLVDADGLDAGLFDDVAYPNQPLNKGREALAIVEVRQAINHAIDREALANVLASGYAVPCSQPWPEGYVAFNEEIGCDYYDYNPEKAIELLAEAGYPDGFDLELLDTPPSATQRTEAVTAMLEAVGINVTVRELAPGTAGDVWLAQAQGDMLSGVWGGRPDPGQMLALQYGENGFLNPGKHRSDALEAQLLLVNDQNLSAEERAEALKEATRISVEEALDVPLFFPLLANVWNEDVVGAEAYLSGKQEFRGVYMAAAE